MLHGMTTCTCLRISCIPDHLGYLSTYKASAFVTISVERALRVHEQFMTSSSTLQPSMIHCRLNPRRHQEVGASAFSQFRYKTNVCYESWWPQTFIGFLIVFSFAVDIAEAQV